MSSHSRVQGTDLFLTVFGSLLVVVVAVVFLTTQGETGVVWWSRATYQAT